MKKFLAVYTGTSQAMEKWKALNEGVAKEKTEKGIKAWGDWGKKYGKQIKEMGGPLGVTKKVDAKGISDINNHMSAFTVVEAESHEAAAKMFIEHPHFTIFPGDGVEIMEIKAIPGAM
jgi:hypothetical protein